MEDSYEIAVTLFLSYWSLGVTAGYLIEAILKDRRRKRAIKMLDDMLKDMLKSTIAPPPYPPQSTTKDIK